jgi:pyruvate dehydrogenase E1 component alpha subunit
MTIRKKAQLLNLYEHLSLIRQAELRLQRLFADNEVPGFIHLSIGQEAIAAGMGHVLSTEDTVASTHRGHGHALAKGVDLDQFFLELMAREEGICKGRGGSMHVADMAVGMLGANAIVGAGIPIATGSALAHQVKKTGALAVAFFGDGAMAEGVLHESLNMASLWKLPMLFVCENNGWGEFTPTEKQFVASLSKIAETFNIPYTKSDGRNLLDVVEVAEPAVAEVRAGNGPQVLEFSVHRFRGHYEGDPQKYRDPNEIEGLSEFDPVLRYEAVLKKRRVATAEIEAVKKRVEARLDKAVEDARQGSVPDFESSVGDVYTMTAGA